MVVVVVVWMLCIDASPDSNINGCVRYLVDSCKESKERGCCLVEGNRLSLKLYAAVFN